MLSSSRPILITLTLAALLGARSEASEQRYYEVQDTGQKIGYSRVVWRDAKWQEKPCVHDSTLVVERGVRDMAGQLDVFETRTLLELDRSSRGELYHQRRRVLEGRRMSLEEVTWTGSSYTVKLRIGREPLIEHTIDMSRPVFVDTEAFLCERAKSGRLRKGQTLTYAALDLRARGTVKVKVEVLGPETIEGADGPVSCTKVRETDPRSGAISTIWMSGEGTLVQLRDDQGLLTKRVPALQAMDMPTKPATFSITVAAKPPLPRIFNADEVRVKILFKPDPNRALPAFPESPWSKILERKGNVITAELRSYDDATPPTRIPVEQPERFKRELEPTPLMPIQDPRLKARAKQVIGTETDARKAAYKLARYVHNTLAKQSPDVASTTALEILQNPRGDCSEHCVLFVALCRSIGIPARRASGFVNIGNDWGAHDWAEIWTGEWIGADPTTGEVGTKARYLFFGYPDRAGSYPARISAQTAGRIQILTTHVAEGSQSHALSSGQLVQRDPAKGNYHQLTTGIQLTGLPSDWSVSMSSTGQVRVRSPGGLRADLRAIADQGDTLAKTFGGSGGQKFAGAPAWIQKWGSTTRIWAHSRRRFVEVSISGGDAAQQAILERALAPTFKEPDLEPKKD